MKENSPGSLKASTKLWNSQLDSEPCWMCKLPGMSTSDRIIFLIDTSRMFSPLILQLQREWTALCVGPHTPKRYGNTFKQTCSLKLVWFWSHSSFYVAGFCFFSVYRIIVKIWWCPYDHLLYLLKQVNVKIIPGVCDRILTDVCLQCDLIGPDGSKNLHKMVSLIVL